MTNMTINELRNKIKACKEELEHQEAEIRAKKEFVLRQEELMMKLINEDRLSVRQFYIIEGNIKHLDKIEVTK